MPRPSRVCSDGVVWASIGFMSVVLVPVLAKAEQVLAAPTFHRHAAQRVESPYNCLLGAVADWAQAQKVWCCKNQQVGCQTSDNETIISDMSTTNASMSPTKEKQVWTWGDDEKNGNLRKTSLTTTSIQVTTTNSCDSLCTVNGVAASCRDQIQQASLSDFLGSVDSCHLAQQVTSEQCPICSGCPPHAAGCGVLELVTSPAPTTTIPKGDACKAVCTLGGQPATCIARIMWSKDHVFADKPKACVQAHAMVLEQCSVCSQCSLKGSTCEDPAPAAGTEELFDCTSGAAVEWSEAKAIWCCEHHERGCDVAPQDKQVFFQKKVSQDAQAADAEQRLARRGRAFAAGFIGLGALGGVVLLFARSSSSARRRCIRYMDQPIDHLISAE